MYLFEKINKFKKALSAGLIVVMLSFAFPSKANAQYVDISNAVKEYVADTLSYFAVNLVIKKVANSTVNWINSGFDGSPAYLTDPKAFFLDVGDNIASDFLSGPQINQLCTPFRAQVRLALVKNYINEGENYSCTLSILKNNYDQFMGDFSQGGWDAWFEMTQNQSNNPYGAYIQAESSLNKLIGAGKDKYSKQLDRSNGFLSYEKCPDAQVVTQSMIDQANQLKANGVNVNSAVAGKKVGDCMGEKETVTPGSVIENKLNQVLGSGENRIEAADEVDEIVGALLNQLISRVIGGIGNGLRGASKSTPTQPSIGDQLNAEPTQKPSNPNAGQVTGGQPNCAMTPTVTTCTTDALGNTSCGSDPGSVDCSVSPVGFNTPPAPDGSGGGTVGGGGGGMCPAYTPDPNSSCTNIDRDTVLAILNKYPATNAGLASAVGEVKGVYPQAALGLANAKGVIDAIDFGNGLAVDVIVGATGTSGSWGWRVACDCNRNPAGGPAN